MIKLPIQYGVLGLLLVVISGCESSSSSDGSGSTGGSAGSGDSSGDPDNNIQPLSLLQIASQPVSSDASPLDIQLLSEALLQIDNNAVDLEPETVNSDDSVVTILNRAQAN